MRLWLESAPDPAGGAYNASLDLLARFRKGKALHGEGRWRNGL